MAFTKTLPDDVLSVIADQIRSSFEPGEGDDIGGVPGVDPPQPSPPSGPPDAPSPAYTIAESFEVWVFARGMTKEYESGNRDLSALCRRSGLWHHQLKLGQSPVGFARSKPLGPTPESWSVREIYQRSPLAVRIDEAIEWMDHHVPEEVEARLLSVPFQQTEAFWFVPKPDSAADEWNDTLLIVITSRRFAELKPGKLVDGNTFLKLMAGPKPGEEFNRKRAPAT